VRVLTSHLIHNWSLRGSVASPGFWLRKGMALDSYFCGVAFCHHLIKHVMMMMMMMTDDSTVSFFLFFSRYQFLVNKDFHCKGFWGKLAVPL